MALVFSVHNCGLGVEVRLQVDDTLVDLFQLSVLDVDLLDGLFILTSGENEINIISTVLTDLLNFHCFFLVLILLEPPPSLDVVRVLQVSFVNLIRTLADKAILLDAPGVELRSLVQAHVHHKLVLGLEPVAIYEAKVISSPLREY